MRGHRSSFASYGVFLFQVIVFTLANNADPNENAASRGISPESSLFVKIRIEGFYSIQKVMNEQLMKFWYLLSR